MKRREFARILSAGSTATAIPFSIISPKVMKKFHTKRVFDGDELSADVVIIGGGLGGCAAALAACRNGKKVILTEETSWIGGQIAQQGVPPDEHPWIETHGAPVSYREYRSRVRDYYRRNYPLTSQARDRKYLNPGDGSVSRLCHEPRVSVAVLYEMLIPYISSGNLSIMTHCKAIGADVKGDQVETVKVVDVIRDKEHILHAPFFVDATELGDLLPMTDTEYITGTESQKETGELHAPKAGDPRNHQAFTWCFAMDYQPGADNTIDRPPNYDYWSSYVPEMDPPWAGKLLELNYSNPRDLQPKELGFHPEGKKTGDNLNLWLYRRMLNRHNFLPGTYDGDITVVNWPQNDYFKGNLIDVSEKDFVKNREDYLWLLDEISSG